MIARDILTGLKLPGFEYTEIRKNGEVGKLQRGNLIILCNTDDKVTPVFTVIQNISVRYKGTDIDKVLKWA